MAELTTEELQAQIDTQLNNCFAIVKAWFPALLGHGLHILSKDQAIFDRAARLIESRLSMTNSDNELLLDSGDKNIAEFIIHFFRRKYSR